ncbi:hypothetical protein F4703DRAFT_1793406 [Phycomyces blakesleeanus]
MLIVFCMLLVPSVQVKHQGSDQSPRLSVSIPSRSSFKVQVKVHRFSIHSIQVKLQGSGQGPRFQVKLQGSRQGPRFSDQGPRFQYPIHPGKASMLRSPSYGHSFYLLLVSAIQVKCQGPDFPAMGIAIDVRRQGCDLPAKCSIIQVNQQDSDLPSMVIAIDVRRQGSDRPAMCSVIQVNQQDSDLPSMVIAIDVKRPGSDLPTMFTGITKRYAHLLCSAIKVKCQGSDCPPMVKAIRVKRQGPDRPSMVIAIRVKHQEPDPPSMSPVINVKRQGPDRPSMVIVIQDKHQGSDLPAMAIVIQVKHLGSDRQSMVKGIKQHYGRILTSFNLVLVSSHPGQASRFYSPVHGVFQIKHQDSDLPAMVIDLIYLQSPAIQIKHQDSDLPAMVIDLIYLQSPAIQVKHQDSHLPAMGIVLNPPRSCFTDPDSVRGYRPNSKDQNSNLGYSSNIKDLISNQGYGYTLFSLSLHAFFRIGLVCLRSGYTMKNLFSFQCDRYIHLVRPLVTVGFISILASQSKPAIMDPISVQRYSVLAVKVPLLSMPMIPNPSPIQSDRATIKDSISIQYDSVFTAQVEEQGFLLHPRLQPRPIDPGLLSSRVTTEANDQSFDILLGSQQAFNAQLYIKGRRYTRIFKQFTKN